MEQKLPLQNGFLYISGFSGETGRPRFFHIIPLQNGPLYFWRFSFFQVVILLKCLLMPGFPFCRGQWLWKSQTCTKKKGWAPWFCRENPLLDLWQVPHSFCRGLGPQKPDLALQNGDTQPPQVIFWGYSFWIYNLQYQTGMKCGTLCWSNLKIAERGENFSQRQKSSVKKNRWSQRAEENHGKSGPLQNQQVNQADFYTSNTGFSTKCIFSETIFQGFMNQCLMPLYSRWISMIWIL